jgi:hypothetical protein
MSKRQETKALTRWENDTRLWAHETSRDLVTAMVRGEPTPATPYRVGVVLDPGELVWAECPMQFLQEGPPVNGQAPPIRPWLVTSTRIVGRLGDGCLYGWHWTQVRGCRADLTSPPEFVALDLADGSRLCWAGPGVGPLAVACVYRLHGLRALVNHPGLEPIRVQGRGVRCSIGRAHHRRRALLPRSA